MNFLNEHEREQLKAQHRKERDRRVCDRIKAVLLYDKGWSISAITEALLLFDDAIRNHISDESLLGKNLRSRVRDKFSPIGA